MQIWKQKSDLASIKINAASLTNFIAAIYAKYSQSDKPPTPHKNVCILCYLKMLSLVYYFFMISEQNAVI